MFDDLQFPKYLKMKGLTNSGRTVESTGNMVAYATYPRCGNSFLRKYLQNITGIATGSDMSLEFNVDLQLSDFVAEEITDESIWIKKSHDPKWNNNNKLSKCNKIVCCVRNPFDIIASMMNFLPHTNQGGTINEDFQKDIPETWDKMVHDCATAIKIYHEIVMSTLKT